MKNNFFNDKILGSNISLYLIWPLKIPNFFSEKSQNFFKKINDRNGQQTFKTL